MSTAIATLNDQEKAALVPANPDAVFGAPLAQKDSAEAPKGYPRIPYVGFRGEKTRDDTGALKAAGIEVSDFYLVDVEPIKVKPFGIHLLPGYQRFYTHVDGKGQVDGVSMEEDIQNKYLEHLYAVVAVALPGAPGQPSSFIPAKINVRSAQAKVFQKTLGLMPAASDPAAWSKRSPAHAKSAAVKFPGGRFRTFITSSIEPAGDSGFDYNLGNSIVSPTPEADVAALNEWMQADFQRIQFVVAAHNIQVAELKRMI